MTEKKTAWVTMPVAGSISLEVEVDEDADEEAVMNAFFDALDKRGTADPNVEFTWEAMSRIVQGNIFYGDVNEMSIEWDD